MPLWEIWQRRSDARACRALAAAVGNPPLAEVVGGDLYGDAVAAQDTDIVLAHLAGDMGGHDVAVLQLDPEGGVGQRFDNGAFHFYVVFFCH